MKKARLALVVVCVAAVWTGVAAAAHRDTQQNVRPTLGNNPHPIMMGGQQRRPAPRPCGRHGLHVPCPPRGHRQHPRQAQQAHADHDHHDDHRRDNHRNRVYVVGWPYADLCGYGPYYGSGYATPYYYPQVVPLPAADFDEPSDADLATERATNAQSIARGQKFIGYGDALFAKGKYAEANVRTARRHRRRRNWPMPGSGRVSPWPPPGATSRRSRPSNAGWLLIPGGPSRASRWTSDTKTTRRPRPGISKPWQPRRKSLNDANLLFLAGVYLYFDGQAARAVPLLGLAAQLAGNHVEHICRSWCMTSWSHRRTVYDGTIARR